MTVRGGTSGKIGDRYENRWFVLKMVDVMNERADFICSEPPGVVGIDFVSEKETRLNIIRSRNQERVVGIGPFVI